MALAPTGSREIDEWPIGRLDVQELSRNGWRPIPIQQYILKIHSRCNLACTYCYVYQMDDQSWRSRPRRMADETLGAAAERVCHHAVTHRLDRIEIVLHGGEPLLTGPDFLRKVVSTLRASLPPGTALTVTVQTNGVLLDTPTLDALLELGIRVGVSLDGGEATHNRYRRYPDGRTSFADVERGLRLLGGARYRRIYAGILCTVDLEEDPLKAYEQLLDFEPPRLDFLLPHGDWTRRPPGRGPDLTTPYADWLGSLFDRWYVARRPRPGIRLFEEILQLLIGGRSRSELVGLSPAALLVVETDGAIEQVDTLRSAYAGATATGLNVFENSIDDALTHPGVVARQIGVQALADECRRCSIGAVCGGGYYGHRYRAGEGFRNPSVYCPDLFALVQRIRATVVAEVARLSGLG